MARIRYDASNPFKPTLHLDGEPISLRQVRRVSVDHVASEMPKVYIETIPGEPLIDVEGVLVEQVVEQAPALDFSSALTQFLDRLDPATLDQAILAQFEGLGGVSSTAQAVINVLKGMANGNGARS